MDADLDVSLQISAQESRRKKKEFVDTLERQVEVASQELDEYKKRCQGLEKENRYACLPCSSSNRLIVLLTQSLTRALR